MLENILFDEIKDSLVRALARTKALNPVYKTTASERVISFISAMNYKAEIKWYDDPDGITTDTGEKALWIKAEIGDHDVIIRSYHINEKFLIDVRGITNPETPLEIGCNLDGVPNLWYRNISKEDLPTEVDKFLCDVLEVI